MEFKSHHKVWNVGWYYDDVDDYLSYVNICLEKWVQNKYDHEIPFFEDKYEIQVASLLLYDNLLPTEARKAFSMLAITAMKEISDTKQQSNVFHIKKPAKGRKKDEFLERQLLSGVAKLIKAGTLKTEAYKIVAQENNKSPDTVRRRYERFMKRRKQ